MVSVIKFLIFVPDIKEWVQIDNFFRAKMSIFYYPSALTFVLDAQKNCVIETVLFEYP